MNFRKQYLLVNLLAFGTFLAIIATSYSIKVSYKKNFNGKYIGGFQSFSYEILKLSKSEWDLVPILFTLAINDRFQMINQCLRELTDDPKMAAKLPKLVKAHDKLCDSVDLYNTSFSVLFLLTLGHLLLATMLSIFNLIHVSSYDRNKTLLNFISSLFFGIYYLVGVLGNMILSTFLGNEVKKSGKLIHKVTIRATDKSVLGKVKINGRILSDNNYLKYFILRFQHFPSKCSINRQRCQLECLL